MMKGQAIILLALLSMAMGQGNVARCTTNPADMIVVVDVSDTLIDNDENFGAYKRSLQRLMDLRDIGPGPGQSRVAICTFGTESTLVHGLEDEQNPQLIKNKIGDKINNGFERLGGFSSHDKGIICALRESRKSNRPRNQKFIVFLVLANDLVTEMTSIEAVELAKRETYLAVVAIGRFRNIDIIRTYPSSQRAYVEIADLGRFVSDSQRIRPLTSTAFCPVDLTTTTTTTTTPSTTTPEGGPCDRCVMINGVGYAATEDCWSFYQCIRGDDGVWREFRRPVAVGAYWNQARISGDIPSRTACPNDPCIGRANGTVIGGYDNCRARIMCMGGVTADVQCCAEGQGLQGDQCVNDANCQAFCEPVTTTPDVCYLRPDIGGDLSRFIATDGERSISMPCPIGTQFTEPICGCDHVEGDSPVRDCRDHPEVRLAFGPDGQVADISRNRFHTTSINFATRETADGSGVFFGVFDGSSLLRVGNSNSGLDRDLTLRIRYRTTQPGPNRHVVSDNECVGTLKTIAIIDDNNDARGFVRTLGDNEVFVDGGSSDGIKEVVMQYTGQDLIIDNNGRINSAPAGELLVSTRFCDGIKLGGSRGEPGFVGEVYEFELFKCLGGGPADFQRSPPGK